MIDSNAFRNRLSSLERVHLAIGIAGRPREMPRSQPWPCIGTPHAFGLLDQGAAVERDLHLLGEDVACRIARA